MKHHNFSNNLNKRQDGLDQKNDKEAQRFRDEVSKIKLAYITKYGPPKSQSEMYIKGIAPPFKNK